MIKAISERTISHILFITLFPNDIPRPFTSLSGVSKKTY